MQPPASQPNDAAPVTMNWMHVTQRLAREFRLPGCFVLDPGRNDWVGMPPPEAFRDYLEGLLATRPPSYFNEIRFFKYSEEPSTEGEARYLALIPMNLKGVPYRFMGLLYESPDKLQELLRFRIMPNYTLFWLYQLVTEARVRNAGAGGHKALVKALEEQRLYAARLESKVERLHDEIRDVRDSELTLDQKLDRMESLLDRQMDEYSTLVDRYQELYNEHHRLQEEFLSTCVQLETRIFELETGDGARAEPAPEQPEQGATATGTVSDQEKTTGRIASLVDRLAQSNKALVAMRDAYENLKTAYDGRTPAEVKQTATALEAMSKRAEHFKKRSEEQEQRIKRLKAQLLADRRRS